MNSSSVQTVRAADALIDIMLEALEAWERWYSEDSTEFNRDTARDTGCIAIAAAKGWKVGKEKARAR